MNTKSSCWDVKSVLFLVTITIGAISIWLLPIVSRYVTRDLGVAVAKVEKEETVLNVEVLEGDVLYETNDSITLLAPAKYKIVRAAYGEDCFYNLADRSAYGSGEDTISVNTAFQYTYRVDCQPLIGRGEITSKAKTVIVLKPAEIRAADIALTSRE